MSEETAFFQGIYQNSPVPVMVFGSGRLPICTAGPLEDLMERTFVRSAERLLPDRFWAERDQCLRTMTGASFESLLLARQLVFQLTPFPYEGKVYAVVTIHEKQDEEFNAQNVKRILRNSQGKLNIYLNSIYGNAEMHGLNSAEYKEVGLGVRRILRMSNHLYRVLDGEDVEFYTVPVELGSFAANCVKAAKEILPDAAIHMEKPRDTFFAEIMPEDMELVLAAMLSNGLRYCSSQVTVRVTGRDGKARITVLDDGAGMVDPDRLPEWGYHAPDRFGQCGLGFSLIMARKLLAQQNAVLEYERANDMTMFHVTLDTVENPRIGRLAEWKPESQQNRLSQMRIELSDYYYYNTMEETK